MATEIVRASEFTRTSISGTLVNGSLAYDGNAATYADGYVMAGRVGGNDKTLDGVAKFGAKTHTWTSYKIKIRYKDLVTTVNSGKGGQAGVWYATAVSNYSAAVDTDTDMNDDYSATPLEVAVSGNPTTANLRVKLTVTSYGGDGTLNGDVCDFYAYEIWLEGEFTSEYASGTYAETGTADGALRASGSVAGSYGPTALAADVRILLGMTSGTATASGLIRGSQIFSGVSSGKYGYSSSVDGIPVNWRINGVYSYTSNIVGRVCAGAVVAGVFSPSAVVESYKVLFSTSEGGFPFAGSADIYRLMGGDVSGAYSYTGTANAYSRHVVFSWAEGKGFRVVQDSTIGGLTQGGITRDALMGALQRYGR